MSCQPTNQNLAFYLQGVTVNPSPDITYDYLTTASLPSSASTRRVWQFITQGTLTGNATLILDYTAAAIKCPEFNITFEGALNGILIIHNQTFSANKFISYQLLSTYVLELTLRVPKAILECYGVGTTQNYYFNINLNDGSTTTCPNGYNCLTYGTDSSGTGYTYTDLSGNLDTLTISDVSGEIKFEYLSSTGSAPIATNDVVEVVVLDTSNVEPSVVVFYYDGSGSNIAFFQNTSGVQIQQQIIYLSSTPNWGLYFDYDQTTSLGTGGFITLSYPTSSVGIDTLSYDTSGAMLTCNIDTTFDVSGSTINTIYFVVAGAVSGDLLTVEISNASSKTVSFEVLDTSGNASEQLSVSTQLMVTYEYGTSGWLPPT